MKALLKMVLPDWLLIQIRKTREKSRRERAIAGWQRAQKRLSPRIVASPAQKLLIFPSDTGSITGALGDDAMITAAVQHFSALNPDIAVSLVCDSEAAARIVREKGFTPVRIPPYDGFADSMLGVLRDGQYDALVILGADIMDGYYGVRFIETILMTADLAARLGMDTMFLGFSFNDRPADDLKAFYDGCDKRVRFNLRDEISLARFRRFTTAQAALVADSAFTLKPSGLNAETIAWVGERHAAGRKVVAFNVHPMLIKNATEAQVARIVEKSAEAIIRTSGGREIAWLLSPHDYRGNLSDGACLRPIHDRLKAEGSVIARYFEGQHRAATLKALAGTLDGVVTGRMHFAIAALGMGVPTLCLTYQDKFEGLYRHFGLSTDLLLPPAIFETEGRLTQALSSFVDNLPELQRQVQASQPKVSALAEGNFVRT